MSSTIFLEKEKTGTTEPVLSLFFVLSSSLQTLSPAVVAVTLATGGPLLYKVFAKHIFRLLLLTLRSHLGVSPVSCGLQQPAFHSAVPPGCHHGLKGSFYLFSKPDAASSCIPQHWERTGAVFGAIAVLPTHCRSGSAHLAPPFLSPPPPQCPFPLLILHHIRPGWW